LLKLIEDETGGDPMNDQKWVRLSLERLSELLAERGHPIDPKTVRRLLLEHRYSLKANRKRFTGPPHPDRDKQFRHIARCKARFLKAGWPVISVDAKKKELIGNFKNPGQTWCEQAEEVNAYDFITDALCRATPYGLYGLNDRRGSVYVGTSADTPEFAVDAINQWWTQQGRRQFQGRHRLLILADSGGSNGCRPRLWKLRLQERLADEWGLSVTVCHYPRGGSKWNPVEHRLFSLISINWAGKPLRTLETMLSLIRGTEVGGHPVQACLLNQEYHTGIKVSDKEFAAIRLQRHHTCPSWNYTITPRIITT
jgi:Rhodopirellula transposase DDE domain